MKNVMLFTLKDDDSTGNFYVIIIYMYHGNECHNIGTILAIYTYMLFTNGMILCFFVYHWLITARCIIG